MARDVLAINRGLLDKLVGALVERETLRARELIDYAAAVVSSGSQRGGDDAVTEPSRWGARL